MHDQVRVKPHSGVMDEDKEKLGTRVMDYKELGCDFCLNNIIMYIPDIENGLFHHVKTSRFYLPYFSSSTQVICPHIVVSDEESAISHILYSPRCLRSQGSYQKT